MSQQNIRKKPVVNIEVKHSIDINADVKDVYKHFINRPFKFAATKFLERKPFLTARLLISPLEFFLKSRKELEEKSREIKVGQRSRPFKVVAIEPGKKVVFEMGHVKVAFIFTDLRAGKSQLDLVDYVATDTLSSRLFLPGFFNFLTIHSIMARKMLKVYKQEIENNN